MDNQQLHELAMSYASAVLTEFLKCGTEDDNEKLHVFMSAYKFATDNAEDKLKELQ
jgi:hypothetical protein